MSEHTREVHVLHTPDNTIAAHSQEAEKQDLPEHLYRLNEEWAIWRTVCLRGAGFPASLALELADPACVELADQMIQLEEELERAREKAVAATLERLDLASPEEHDTLKQLMRTLRKIQQPQPFPTANINCPAIEQLRDIYQHLGRLQAAFPGAFSAATLRSSQALHTLARQDRFREAITWQNRQAIHSGIDSLLHYTPAQTSQNTKQRRHEALVVHYLQRYAMKNDSIGFFGPIGIAQVEPEEKTIAVQPGPCLLASRHVYFEGWCIDALAEALATNKQILPWCSPRLMPHLHLDEQILSAPFAPPIQLTSAQAAILQRCAGVRTAREIARELITDPVSALRSETEVYTVLEQLSAARRIIWTLEIPPEGAPPEQALRHLLLRIEDDELRSTCLQALERLEHARLDVERAGGDAEQLAQALSRLEALFTELTGKASTRSEGKMYAGRTLVYEDCRRSSEVKIGTEVIHAMQEPLTLLLTSARWFSQQVADLYQQAFLEAYTELAEETDDGMVKLADFWLWMQPLLYTDAERLSDLVTSEFQARWSEILTFQEDQQQVAYSSEQLRPLVEEAFAAPGPGWNAARYHSPDILIAARSPQAIQQGDFQIVLGEFHIAMNTLQIRAFLAQHPEAERILSNAALDIPEPRLLPILSKDVFPNSRVRPALVTAKDVRLVYTPDVCASFLEQALTLGSLVVELSHGTLIARTRDGRWQFSLIEVFAEFLSRLVFSSFKLTLPVRHTPRISIDRVIVARETWRFSASELSFSSAKDPGERFLQARRWVRKNHLPRFIFAKVPTEQKPCFIDLACPVFIDMLAKLARQNADTDPDELPIVLTEMVPAPDALWLKDAEGQSYTSELRFVGVDLIGK